jgi:hypothetical protein
MLPLLGSLEAVWNQAVGLHLEARSLPLGGLDATVWGEAPIAALGLAGLLAALQRARLLAAIGTAWFLAALAFVAVQRPLWSHHLVILTPGLAMWGGGLALLRVLRVPRVTSALTAGVAAAGLLSAFYVGAHQSPDAADRRLVSALRADTAPGDLVVTDDPYVAALAGRSTPPELVDVTLRVNSGDLTSAEAEGVASRPGVRAVLFANHRLFDLPGFQAWTARNFPVVKDLGNGRRLYLRQS